VSSIGFHWILSDEWQLQDKRSDALDSLGTSAGARIQRSILDIAPSGA
jgi:hypothetical protein